jgi:glycine cleavage system H protein
LYHEGHTWLDRTTHGVIVGITEHAQDALAEVAHIDLPQPGASIAQSGTLAEIESLKCVWELESPISGVVLTINPMLPERPELLNDDPYVAGWIVEMRATVPTEFETLLGADAYEGLLQ